MLLEVEQRRQKAREAALAILSGPPIDVDGDSGEGYCCYP